MSVKTRNLGVDICYLFNGKDFIINENLSEGEFKEIMNYCRENDPDRVAKKTVDVTTSIRSAPSCRFLFIKD